MTARRPKFPPTAPVPWGRGKIRRPAGRSWWPNAIAGTVLLLLAATAPAMAGDGGLDIDLNRLEAVDGGCRLSFVLTNTMDVSVDALTMEAVLFDGEGRVDRFLLLKAWSLPAGRTRVQRFDVGETSCERIVRVLLNDVTACAGDGLAPAACLEAIRPASRSGIPFTTTLSAVPSE